jgi:metallo-beta-lactamase class B
MAPFSNLGATTMTVLSALAVIVAATAAMPASAHDDVAIGKAIDCGNCVKWNVPQQPFKVVGNTWYVGTKELSSVLVTGPKGHILLDGALPQSALQIEANIKALGFRVKDIKYILTTHAHWDHAGGIPVLARDSGATVVATAAAASVLRAGVIGSDDPQFDTTGNTHWAKLDKVREIVDGEVVKVGPLAITAQTTPGHTPGGASWSWKSCEGKVCHDVVYVDSLNPVSTDGYYFSGDDKTPDISRAFAASIAKVAALKCDVVLSAHPDFSDMLEKLAKTTPAHNAFIDANSCKAYAADAGERLTKRLEKEQQQKAVAGK